MFFISHFVSIFIYITGVFPVCDKGAHEQGDLSVPVNAVIFAFHLLLRYICRLQAVRAHIKRNGLAVRLVNERIGDQRGITPFVQAVISAVYLPLVFIGHLVSVFIHIVQYGLSIRSIYTGIGDQGNCAQLIKLIEFTFDFLLGYIFHDCPILTHITPDRPILPVNKGICDQCRYT